MADRSATDTIRGYFYQFDYSIERILSMTDDADAIVVEGVEDVDIQTATEETAVQCKYHADTEYNHSIIAKPVRFMLNHFADVRAGTKSKLFYKLRGYYKSGQHKLILPIDLQFLKDNLLTYTRTEKIANVLTKVKHFHHLDLKLDDSALNDFIGQLEIDINAKDFDTQYSDILLLLKDIFSCSHFVAEYFYYNNALGLIRSLSKDPDITRRQITKKQFLQRIDTSNILFNEWFIKVRGVKAHFEALRREYFGSVNILFKERFFLIEITPSSYSRTEIKELLNLLIKKFTKIIKQPNPFCPYIYLHGIDKIELIEIKKDLIADGILIHDGFDFEGSAFNPNSLFRKPNLHYPLGAKFLNHIGHVSQMLALTGRTSEIYQFYIKASFFEANNPSIKEVRIQVDQLKNIKSII